MASKYLIRVEEPGLEPYFVEASTKADAHEEMRRIARAAEEDLPRSERSGDPRDGAIYVYSPLVGTVSIELLGPAW